MKRLLLIAIALMAELCSASTTEVLAPYQMGQKLMVDERGKIVPEGYAVGITDIAEAVASQRVVQATATVVREAQKAAADEVRGAVPDQGNLIKVPAEVITPENAQKFYFPDSVY